MLAQLHQHEPWGYVKPLIDRVYPFDQVREAIAYMESGDKLGKIMIKIG